MNRIRRSRPLRFLRLLLGSLPKRAWLTLRHEGLRTFGYRILTFPLRLTPLGRRLGLGPRLDQRARARSWYRARGVPVTIVIPTYGPPALAVECVRSLRRTVDPKRVKIVVCDDGSASEHQASLREIDGIELVLGEENAGFAANVNRGLARAAAGDIVVMNSDVVAHDDWLELLQFCAYGDESAGIAGPRLLYPDGTIQSAGSYRNLAAPEWFDHRFRFAPADHGPASVVVPVVATTGACMYIKREVIERVGIFDERFGMAYEDGDYCLRAWEAGYRVIYCPDAELTHQESKTRGMEQGERELDAQAYFWEKWGDWFDRREVRAPDGRLRIIYVTEDTGVGGGHRVVFEHVNGLAARGHDVELYTLAEPPDWFELDVPVRVFDDFVALADALAEQDAIKVATWWNTAPWVWLGSVRRGIPVYFVQDIETSYYPESGALQNAVLASYRQEFRYLTTSSWNRERLAELGLEADVVAPGIDLDRFRETGAGRADGALVAVGRSNPLKNFPLTHEAWRALPEPRPELWLFGIEPGLATDDGVRYWEAPSDEEVNDLYNRSTAFVQTSRHEGFCLPILEAMATGAPVVCTDADGNRDFCRDGENCLMPAADRDAVRDAIARLLADPELRERLGREGRLTALRYDWPSRIDELEAFFERVAPRALA